MNLPHGAHASDGLRGLVDRFACDFHSYFRKRGLALKESHVAGVFDKEEALCVHRDLKTPLPLARFFHNHLPEIKEHLVDLLLTPQGAQILWHLYCSPGHAARSLLGDLLPSLEAIADTVRVGPNVYKLNGWMVHVLVGYGMATSYIPRGELPQTVEWPEEARAFCRQELRSKYWNLGEEGRFVLHIAMLGHDIGVRKAVADHDVHGVPMVPGYLRELGLDQKALMRISSAIKLDDLTWAIQAIVRHHALVNRVGVEFSLHRSAWELAELVQAADCAVWRKNFLQQRLATILLIVGTSDLVAVDDALLSRRKTAELQRGHELLLTLLDGRSIRRDPISDGIERFRAFLSDKNNGRFSLPEAERILHLSGYTPHDFWTRFFYIGELNFALSLVRYLPSEMDTLYVFLLLIRFLDENLGPDFQELDKVRVVFDPGMEAERLGGVINELRRQEMGQLAQGHRGGKPTQAAALDFRFSKTDQGHETLVSMK